MSVIKAKDALAKTARWPVLTAARPPELSPMPVDPLREALEVELQAQSRQIEELIDQVALLQEELAAVRDEASVGRILLAEKDAEIQAAVADAAVAGREDGRREGAEAKVEILLALDAAITRTAEQLRADMQSLEPIAIALARAALTKVFGDTPHIDDRIARLVRRQLESLDRAAVLSVTVSANDFSDDDALATLSAAAGLEGLVVQASEALGSGDCRMRLRLGELDVGLSRQWSSLRALLDDALAEPEGE